MQGEHEQLVRVNETMNNDEIRKNLELASRAIKSADALLVGAGAGMGVDSGLPDFRGNEGFWRAYPKLKNQNLTFSDMANPKWFHKKPRQAWGFYGHRYNLYAKTQPHAGFNLLKKWSDQKSFGSFVYTSNVDGHFQRAGFKENQIVECHGAINHFQCINLCSSDVWPVYGTYIEVDEEHLLATSDLPQCPHCKKLARPNILMFNDFHWIEDRTNKQQELYSQWSEKSHNVVVIEIGAGLAIPTVRSACEVTGAFIIRINPREYLVEPPGISIPLGAEEALIKLDRLMK